MVTLSQKELHRREAIQKIRDRRLSEARKRLLEGGPNVSVAAIAKECGFAHLGRFSAHFRARFGELPTETRGRARSDAR